MNANTQETINKFKNSLSLQTIIMYVVEALAIILAAYVIPSRRTNFNEVASLTFVVALVLYILDFFSDTVGIGTRLGAGLGIGYKLVGASI